MRTRATTALLTSLMIVGCVGPPKVPFGEPPTSAAPQPSASTEPTAPSPTTAPEEAIAAESVPRRPADPRSAGRFQSASTSLSDAAGDPHPHVLDYRGGVTADGKPPSFVSRSRRSRGLTIAGWSTLGGLWALSSIYAGLGYAVSDIGGREQEEGWLALLIPVAGPFVAMGTLNVLTLRDSAPAAILLVDGILQTSALAMLIAGAATRHPGRSALELTPAVRLTPFVGVSNAGVVGTF